MNLLQYWFCFMFCFFGHKLWGILASWPGVESVPPALKAQSLNCWTVREVSGHGLLYNLACMRSWPRAWHMPCSDIGQDGVKPPEAQMTLSALILPPSLPTRPSQEAPGFSPAEQAWKCWLLPMDWWMISGGPWGNKEGFWAGRVKPLSCLTSHVWTPSLCEPSQKVWVGPSPGPFSKD